MARIFAKYAAFLLLSILPWIGSCSKRSLETHHIELPELNVRLILGFTALLTGDPNDPLFVKLRDGLTSRRSYQQFCLKYLVGSVAIFGKVDEAALAILRGLCGPVGIRHLSDLADALARANNSKAAAWCLAEDIGRGEDRCVNRVGSLILRLAERSWNVFGELVVMILKVLRRNQYCEYRFMLRRLPIEQRHVIVNDPDTPLNLVTDIYSLCISDHLLRELLASNLYICDHATRLYNYFAVRNCHCKQVPANSTTFSEDTQLDSFSTLSADVCHCIFGFVDVETLFVLQFVCKSWNRAHSKILGRDTRIHDLYLEELYATGLLEIHTIAPWKYFLRSQETALKYFGQCIAMGALGRVGPNRDLMLEAQRYLETLIDNQVPPPKVGGLTPYSSFLNTFEKIYEYCADDRPHFSKPDFLTDHECEQAIHHLVCARRWILRLPKLWIVDNMPKLFNMLKEDEVFMEELILSNFDTFIEPVIILLAPGQIDDMSERLIKLILLPRMKSFKDSIGSQAVQLSDYYEFIVDSGVLFHLTLNTYWIDRFSRFMVSLLLFFKDKQEKINSIVASMAAQFSNLNSAVSRRVICLFKKEIAKLLEDMSEHPESVNFVKGSVMRSGL